MKKILFAVLFTTCLSSLVFGQKPVEVSLRLRDGSNVSGTTSMTDLSLSTDYGKLLIPIRNVSSIKVGIPTDKATSDKAKSLLGQLTNTNEDIKKVAYDELVKLGIKAIPAVNDFISDPKNLAEYTGEFTPDNALNELKANCNIDDVSDTKDVISIDGGYTMGGVYEFVKLEVKTEYGNLSIPKEKITSIDVMFLNSDGAGELSFKLSGAKNISANTNGGWLKTGIMLKAGQKFSITASGEVTLASLSNQKYHPDGSYETATGEKYNGAGGTDEYSSSATTYPAYGNVVYRVGDNVSQNLKAGARFTGTAPNAGMLYLAIYETVYNAANSGSYAVKVVLK